MAEKIKEYKVKVPVYTSGNIINEEYLFGSTFSQMVENTKTIINQYNNDIGWHVRSDKRAKTNVIGINKINAIDCNIGSDNCLLLQTTVYKTNLVDGYYEGENNDVILFKEKDKLCSDTHFLLLYPNCLLDNNGDVVYWRVFVYEDPTKSNEEVTRVAKLIMKDILKCPIRNIKEDKLLSELREQKIINGIEIKLTSLDDDDDDTPPYLLDYFVESKLKKERKIKFQNIPSIEAVEIYNDVNFQNSYNKRQINYLLNDRRVLTVTQEFQEKMNEVFEDCFNYSFNITEQELKNGDIFNVNFILKRMTDLIKNFMSINGNNL